MHLADFPDLLPNTNFPGLRATDDFNFTIARFAEYFAIFRVDYGDAGTESSSSNHGGHALGGIAYTLQWYIILGSHIVSMKKIPLELAAVNDA
jgi:hypothetical protein